MAAGHGVPGRAPANSPSVAWTGLKAGVRAPDYVFSALWVPTVPSWDPCSEPTARGPRLLPQLRKGLGYY